MKANRNKTTAQTDKKTTETDKVSFVSMKAVQRKIFGNLLNQHKHANIELLIGEHETDFSIH